MPTAQSGNGLFEGCVIEIPLASEAFLIVGR
jgi:hypothetical protein